MQPNTDSQYAYLVVEGDMKPAEITKTLSLEPDDFWQKGDVHARIPNLKKPSNHWRLDSGLKDTHALAEHLDALLSRLSGKNLQVQRLAKTELVSVRCVGYVYQSFGLEIPHRQLAQIADLGIGVGVSCYPLGDIHEELTELRQTLRTM